MLRVRSLLLGTAASLLLFLLFLVCLSFIAAKTGSLDPGVYRSLSLIFAGAAILAGSFLAAKTAKGKGAIYGLILTALWLAWTLAGSAVLGSLGEGSGIIFRVFLYLTAGVLGGVLGITLKRKRRYY